MKKVIASLLLLFIFSHDSFSQMKPLRSRSLGVSVSFYDFTTAQRIRTGSIEKVFREKTWAKWKEMSPGVSVTYYRGLQRKIEFAGTLAGVFLRYPFPNKPAYTDNALLLEANAAVLFKMFDESYWVSPFLSVGAGGSMYKNHFGAIIPIGAGFKVNMSEGASVVVNAQYRVPVTAENANYHFVYSIGFAGSLGAKR